MHRPLDIRPALLTRAVAVLAAGLILSLAVLAASPELHERLHGHTTLGAAPAQHATGHETGGAAADDEDGCIVTLFAQGVVMAVALLAPAVAFLILRAGNFLCVDRVAPQFPFYLRLPAQGPPAGLI